MTSHNHGHRLAAEDMLSVEEAYERVMASFQTLEAEEKPLLDCMGQVLAEDILSPLALPPLANSGMDGYALRHSDIAGASQENPKNLSVIGVVAAGQMPDKPVTPGTAIRIMTGAPVPGGADTVVPFEETDEVQRKKEGKPLDQVAIFADMPVGCNVRPAGEDVSPGALVLEKGTAVRAAEVGVIASLGLAKVKVIRRPVVAVLATGDELENLGAPLTSGKIYDSNSFSVAASVAASGGIPKILGIARDNEESLRRVLDGARGADLLVTMGGASVGDFDLVKKVLGEDGLDLGFYKVAMRPGKPLIFGRLKGIPLLGLPGNPVSAGVTSVIFLKAAIAEMLGIGDGELGPRTALLGRDLGENDHRQDYLRATLSHDKDGQLVATPFDKQDSAMMARLAEADCLVVRPPNAPAANKGEPAEIIPLDVPGGCA